MRWKKTARLGPKALINRLEELSARTDNLRAQSDAKNDEVLRLQGEIEALEAFTSAVERLAGPLEADTGAPALLAPAGAPWKRHTIEQGLRKSEGIRLGDVNHDGLQDLAVAWEGQEVARLYLNPGPLEVTAPWAKRHRGHDPRVEDSVLVDLDNDGALDVISSLENGTEEVQVSWGPANPAEALNPRAWTHDSFKQLSHVTMWMYATPIRLAPGAPP